MTDDYFDDRMINRQRLLWAIATRVELERWEPYVAAAVRDKPPLTGAEIWQAATEHHFTLVAAWHLIDAVDLAPTRTIPIDPTLRAELIEGRHLHEHWRENLPVFSNTPRVEEPRHRSGKDFAARNPERGRDPYRWLRWSSKTGPMLLPHVPASGVHEFVDAVEAEVLAQDDELKHFLPLRAPSPWLVEDGEWWPTSATVDES
jgi:hypothetical protein